MFHISLFVLFFMLGLPEQLDAAYELKPNGANASHTYGQSHQGFSYPFMKSKKQVDFSCFVSANSAYGKLKSGWTMVDLRTESAFETFRVPGSINISAHALASRTFLKNRRLLLIDDGFNIDHMASLCGELKKAGFSSVSALFGGLARWHQSGFSFEGRAPRHSQLLSMSPDRFFQMKDAGFWQVIHVSIKETVATRSFFPESVATGEWKNVGRELDRIAAKHGGMQKPVAMIVVDQNGSGYEKNIGVVKGKGYPIFFLAGGLDAYRTYLGKQKIIREHLLHPPQRRNFCGY